MVLGLSFDADAASNRELAMGGGTGTDSTPYFRIFNPVTQGQKFGPNGDYIKIYRLKISHLNFYFVHGNAH